MSRGRPSEQVEIKTKWVQEFTEFPSKPELGYTSTWHYDTSKAPNGPYKTTMSYPKNYKIANDPIIKSQVYGGLPVVMVFKSSNRGNAKVKMKIWKNTNVDYINSCGKLPGVPTTAVILELATGHTFIEKFKLEYNL
jgi:hypothetical protein